jgi:CRP-like cAMP-binding protein
MRILLRYIHVRMQGLAQNTACTRFHVVEERLARLLLMTQDRVPSSAIQLTHEAMADRLGVRRAGITIAASALQREELITYHRGAITILDRQGLEAAACSCYGADNETYAGIMGGWIDPWARRERTAS